MELFLVLLSSEKIEETNNDRKFTDTQMTLFFSEKMCPLGSLNVFDCDNKILIISRLLIQLSETKTEFKSIFNDTCKSI